MSVDNFAAPSIYFNSIRIDRRINMIYYLVFAHSIYHIMDLWQNAICQIEVLAETCREPSQQINHRLMWLKQKYALFQKHNLYCVQHLS